jgi:hypothetical protein
MIDRALLVSRFDQLLPLAVEWAMEQEARILREGVSLTNEEKVVARQAGVGQPERVRLLQVKTIPRPEHEALEAACDAIDFLTPATRGLALGYGIFVRTDCWRDAGLIAHELVHTAQYERLGGIEGFLRQYLMECLTVGYPESPLEQEAITRSASVR